MLMDWEPTNGKDASSRHINALDVWQLQPKRQA